MDYSQQRSLQHKPEFCLGNLSRVPEICLENVSKVPKLCLDKIDLSLGNFSRVPQFRLGNFDLPRNYRGFRPLCYTLVAIVSDSMLWHACIAEHQVHPACLVMVLAMIIFITGVYHSGRTFHPSQFRFRLHWSWCECRLDGIYTVQKMIFVQNLLSRLWCSHSTCYFSS